MLAILPKQKQALVAAAAAAASLVTALGLLGVRCHRARVAELAAALPPPMPSAAPAVAPSGPPRFVEELDVTTFQKGNIHTHSNWSDGDSPPQDLYAWYRDHGYAFLAVTDHNILTDPAQFRLLERKGSFVMIPGEEVTMMGHGHQVHVNAICTSRAIGGHHADTAAGALAWAVAQVKAQGGVALVNHPNFDWSLTADDLPGARGAALLEIASGHPFVHTEGDATHKSHEAIWDTALTRGESFAGVAVDDAHYFKRSTETLALPGRAWIEVFASEPSRAPICDALSKGRLYASTGVKLRRIAVTRDTYAITLDDRAAEVEFIGKGGQVLQRGAPDEANVASYALKGGEGYVRAKVKAAGGKNAWTQAVRLAP